MVDIIDPDGEISLDFGFVNELPPEGTYLIKVEKSEVLPAGVKEDGTAKEPAWSLWLKIIDPRHAEWEGKMAFDTISLGRKSRFRVQQAAEALTRRNWEEDNVKFRASEFLNCECYCNLIHNEYQGKTTLKPAYPTGYLREYQPFSGGLSTPQQMPSAGMQAPQAQAGGFRI